MGGLHIGDLSFCEIVSDSQVCGGLSAAITSRLSPVLKTYISSISNNVSVLAKPVLEKYSSEETNGYLVEKSKDESGNNFVYQVTSQDGKKLASVSTGSVDNLNYVVSTAKIST